MSTKKHNSNDEDSQTLQTDESPDEKTPAEKLPESRGDVADRAEEQIEATIQDKIAEIRRKVNGNFRIAK